MCVSLEIQWAGCEASLLKVKFDMNKMGTGEILLFSVPEIFSDIIENEIITGVINE